MRRGLAATLTAAMLLLIPSSAGATGARDYAKGSGTQFIGTSNERSFAFNAWSDPAGNDPEGSIKFEDRGVTYFATVTCLQVIGNTAVIWGDVTHWSTEAAVFNEAIKITAIDLSDDEVPDEVAINLLFESVPEHLCGPPADFGFFPLDRGDVTVFDE